MIGITSGTARKLRDKYNMNKDLIDDCTIMIKLFADAGRSLVMVDITKYSFNEVSECKRQLRNKGFVVDDLGDKIQIQF